MPELSLTLPSQGHPGSSHSVDAGILSLREGVGSGEGLLSLGVKPDLPLLAPVAFKAAVGSPQGLVSVDPPALPPVLGVDPGGVLPPVNVPPVFSSLLPPILPAVSTPGGSSSVIVPPAAAAPQPATLTAPALAIGVTGLEGPVVTGDNSSPTALHSPQFNDLTFASFSALPSEPNAGPSLRAESGGDDLEEELFSLRDGRLLEDFGTAMADDAALLSAPSDDASQAEGENATALWLVGLLAGCAAGSAWLSARREREADPVDANPSLIPLG